jgi:DNA-binding FadR family transcriptional regulator
MLLFMDDKTLVATTVERLIKYIVINDLHPTAKLPNEFELADLLQVGRSTVREAVKVLVSRNILEVRQGAGTFVVERQIGIAQDPLGFTFIKDKQKLVNDLLEIRMMIEPRIASMAATSATDKDVEEMRAILEKIEMQIISNIDHTESDIAFHRKIAESSGNVVAPNLMPVIQTGITLFVDMTNRTLRRETIETHRAILNAIAAHKPMAAADAMTLHIVYNRLRLGEIADRGN